MARSDERRKRRGKEEGEEKENEKEKRVKKSDEFWASMTKLSGKRLL